MKIEIQMNLLTLTLIGGVAAQNNFFATFTSNLDGTKVAEISSEKYVEQFMRADGATDENVKTMYKFLEMYANRVSFGQLLQTGFSDVSNKSFNIADKKAFNFGGRYELYFKVKADGCFYDVPVSESKGYIGE